MHAIQREHARAWFAERGLSRALITSTPAVKWLTGFAVPITTGPNPFTGADPLVWYENGEFTLVVVEGQTGIAADFAGDPDCRVIGYEGYSVDSPIQGHRNVKESLRDTIGRGQGTVGVESFTLPAFLWPLLNADIAEIDGWTVPLRRIKTDEELAKLRENFALADIGQAAAREAVNPGATEMDVYLAAYSAVHRAAGEVVPVGNDFVASNRRNNGGGMPGTAAIGAEGSCIVDISTIRYGYWSDSCETYYANVPTDDQMARRKVVADALKAGIDMLRPGVRACDVDRKLRAMIEVAGYPVYAHHSGHGVGVTGHEAPRIVPYNEEVLEAGMVVMLEPGIYEPEKSAVRLEHGVLIREEAPEVLTRHILDL